MLGRVNTPTLTRSRWGREPATPDSSRYREPVQVMSAPETHAPRGYCPTLTRPRWEREPATPDSSRYREPVQVVSAPEACAPSRY